MKEPLSGLCDPRYLVLSEKNVPLGSLAEGIENLWKSFSRLRRSVLWKWVKGAVAVLEVTFNRQDRTWHPHLNVIFDGPFLPQDELSRVWQWATDGRGRIVWIERADGDGTALEVFKYVTKLADIADVPEAVQEFLAATHKVRFLRTYGSLYRLPEEEDFRLECPDCGTHNVQRLGFIPYEAVALDAQRVLRFDESFLVEASPPRDLGPPVELASWPEPVFPLSNSICRPEVYIA